jgi:hypothetical protein
VYVHSTVKRIFKSTPTMEGAGVKLLRAFGFGNTGDFDPFPFDDFRNDRPRTTAPVFPGTRRGIETMPMCCPARSGTPTAWATRAGSAPATCSG